MKRFVFGALVLGLLVLTALRSWNRSRGPEPPAEIFFRGSTMGTSYTIRLGAGTAGEVTEELQQKVDARLDQINSEMSTYLNDSELSRFNQSSSDDWFAVSPDTAAVVAAGQRVAEQSGGAFDITVGPLVNLWNFGPDQHPLGVPTEADIQEAISKVGYSNLEVRLNPPALRKRRADLYVDLSAIAKGFAVDAIAGLLESHGIAGYMIEIGGEIRTKGSRPGGTGWRIGIERPVRNDRAIYRVVQLQDRALATSGDYRNYFEWEGRIYSHEIDPRTGRPAAVGTASVTVLSDRTMLADAWATALMVMAPDRAWQVVQEQGLDVMIIFHQGNGFSEKMTAGFAAVCTSSQLKGGE